MGQRKVAAIGAVLFLGYVLCSAMAHFMGWSTMAELSAGLVQAVGGIGFITDLAILLFVSYGLYCIWQCWRAGYDD